MELKTIDLFGKPLFNLVKMEGFINMPTPMSDQEAAFVFVLEGGCISYSEVEEIQKPHEQKAFSVTPQKHIAA